MKNVSKHDKKIHTKSEIHKIRKGLSVYKIESINEFNILMADNVKSGNFELTQM